MLSLAVLRTHVSKYHMNIALLIQFFSSDKEMQYLSHTTAGTIVESGFDSWHRIISFSWQYLTGSGAIPASYPMVSGTSCIGLKWLGQKAEHLTQSSTKDMNVWSYTSINLYVLTSCCWIRHKIWLLFIDPVVKNKSPSKWRIIITFTSGEKT
jgi:hypothetical protein